MRTYYCDANGAPLLFAPRPDGYVYERVALIIAKRAADGLSGSRRRATKASAYEMAMAMLRRGVASAEVLGLVAP